MRINGVKIDKKSSISLPTIVSSTRPSSDDVNAAKIGGKIASLKRNETIRSGL